jgi:choline dehydrogenase-like flavoprotein
MLGGSSSLNGMMYVRGQPEDYAELARQCGPDWDWNHIAAAFVESEQHALGKAATRGDKGPLRISMPAVDPLLDALIACGPKLGLERQIDINEPDNAEKIGYCPRTIWRGRRQNAAAFLRRATGRPNLHVRTGVLADRVVFDGRQAIGVDCSVNGDATHFAGRKIILSAGTFGSPAILQRSGIGPRSHLQSLGIEVVADRPAVGANLHEHCALALQFRVRAGMSQNASFSGWRLLLNGLRYYLTRSGPLSTGAYEAGGWFKTRTGLERPNAQFIAAPFSTDRTKGKGKLVMESHPGMQIAVYPLRPRATGDTNIVSRDPAALPSVSLDFFEDAEDRREMIEAVRFVRTLVRGGPLSRIVEKETRPGPQFQSDEEILDAYRTLGTTAYHAVGTCRMGTDDGSVVDPRTRVRGVTGLHVVDLSIAPFVIAGNTFGPTVAMARRAADLIVATG